MRKLRVLCIAAFIGVTANSTFAADYPDRPVHIVVPFPAGAAADGATRVVARKLSDYWGKPVIVDNRPGVPGIQGVAAAPADGYTLLLGAGSSIVTNPLILSKLPYNPQKDFAPIGKVVTNTSILTVHPSLGVKSVKELIALAKRKPRELNYTSSGIGSPNHLGMEWFMELTGTDMVHVPYKGGAPSVIELVGGHVQLGINAIPSVLEHVKSGKLIAIGVASTTRDRALPDLPTISESGVPGFVFPGWYGLFAPSKTPADNISKISADLQRALKDPEVVKQLWAQGNEPSPTTIQEFSQFIKEDTASWAKLIKDRKLKVEE